MLRVFGQPDRRHFGHRRRFDVVAAWKFDRMARSVAPAGRVAELERSLIVERVKAGLRNARAKGKRLGRPKRVVDAHRISELRAQGTGWKRIAAELGIGVGTLYRLAGEGSKIREKAFEPREQQGLW